MTGRVPTQLCQSTFPPNLDGTRSHPTLDPSIPQPWHGGGFAAGSWIIITFQTIYLHRFNTKSYVPSRSSRNLYLYIIQGVPLSWRAERANSVWIYHTCINPPTSPSVERDRPPFQARNPSNTYRQSLQSMPASKPTACRPCSFGFCIGELESFFRAHEEFFPRGERILGILSPGCK